MQKDQGLTIEQIGKIMTQDTDMRIVPFSPEYVKAGTCVECQSEYDELVGYIEHRKYRLCLGCYTTLKKDCVDNKLHAKLKSKYRFGGVDAQLQESTIEEKDDLIEIALPQEGKLISKFVDEMADVITDKNVLFFRQETGDIIEVTIINKNEEDEVIGFSKTDPNRFITLVERFFTPIRITFKKDKETDKLEEIRKEKSMSSQLASVSLAAQKLQEKLPQISRIFSVPIPIKYKGELTFPKRGYDPRFKSWLDHNSPEIENPAMELEEAKEIVDKIMKEFCFEKDTDKTVAIAALITPFLRGLFPSFSTRTPVIFYLSNRERAGKDYCAGVVGVLYEGKKLEEPPISTGEKGFGGSNDELRKKLLSAMINGRKRLHFANNKGFINNAVFEGAVTAEQYSDRILGKNEIVILSNEIDYSLSGNVGVTFTPDLANRCLFVRLFLAMEDANQRVFETPNLHEFILKNRGKILSAIYSLIRNWADKGSSKGTKPFASFPEWADVCGGVMEAAGYDSPCDKSDDPLLLGGDTQTKDMKELFEIAYEEKPDEWMFKSELRDLISKVDSNIFSYYNFKERSDQIKFGKEITKFYRRILSNIKLEIQDISVRSNRQKIRFTKIKVEEGERSENKPSGNVGNVGNVC